LTVSEVADRLGLWPRPSTSCARAAPYITSGCWTRSGSLRSGFSSLWKNAPPTREWHHQPLHPRAALRKGEAHDRDHRRHAARHTARCRLLRCRLSGSTLRMVGRTAAATRNEQPTLPADGTRIDGWPPSRESTDCSPCWRQV